MLIICFLVAVVTPGSIYLILVLKMNSMFGFCKSLTKLNLTNFITEKVEDFDIKFFLLGCKSSKKENIIATDKKILERYFK